MPGHEVRLRHMRLNSTNISIIKRLLVGRNSRPLRSILMRLGEVDLASLYSHLNELEKKHLSEALLSFGQLGPVLLELPSHQVAEVILDLEPVKRRDLIAGAPESEAADFLEALPADTQLQILSQMEPAKRSRLQLFLDYPENSAGRLMIEEVFTLDRDLTASQCLEEIRRRSSAESIYYVYCTDSGRRLEGVASLRTLVTAHPDEKLGRIARKDVISVTPETLPEEVANLVSRYDFVALPVVDAQNRLLGIVTVDDILDLVQDQATARIYKSAGLQEDDRVYTPFSTSLKKRLPWMLLNLLLAATASAVISLFEKTIAELVILATVQNIVAATGGNTAIQTLTVVTRGLATDDFQFISLKRALLKEAYVGLNMGVILGVCAAALVYFWKGSLLVAIVIGISMVLNLLIASTMGAIMPVAIRKLNFDPAVSSGVLVTVFTDIFGFMSFLGIATLGLKYFTNYFGT